ncbi:MAG: replication initiation protein [Lachnospiraceae bacterium]|nr:replication initiation protein [Lachnospiraceae bacterium]
MKNNNEKLEFYSPGIRYSKGNALISAKYKSTITENKLLNCAIANVKNGEVDAEGSVIVRMSRSQLSKLMGWKAGTYFSNLDKTAEMLSGRVMGYSNPDTESFEYVPLITKAKYENNELTIRFAPEMKDKLIQLTNNFTVLDLGVVTSFKSNYSLRLYEILKSKAYIPKGETARDPNKIVVDIDVAELKFEMGTINIEVGGVKKTLIETSKNSISGTPDYNKALEKVKEQTNDDWRHFKRTIDKAVDEINEKTELKVSYEPSAREGKGGRIKSLYFYIDKTPAGVKNEEHKIEDNTPLMEYNEDDLVDEVLDLAYEIERIRVADCRAIIKAAGYDLEKVKIAHEAARQQREFKTSYTAFMIWAINNQIKPNEKTVIRSGFNDFDQRKYDYEELERAALQ